jgi:hypothetical protein
LREKEGGRRDITMADRRLRNNISGQRGIYVENNEKEGQYVCGKTGTDAGGGRERGERNRRGRDLEKDKIVKKRMEKDVGTGWRRRRRERDLDEEKIGKRKSWKRMWELGGEGGGGWE